MPNLNYEHLSSIANLLRYYILTSTTEAGSGHPTSSLSAVEIMTSLMFGNFFRYDPKNPDFPNNDRLIFSKGHAAPLFYALWAVAGLLSEKELMTLRKFGSPLEGHPTLEFPFTEVPTGSLGQGLSVGVGMALNAKYLDKLPYKTYVLLGDGEITEGSNWESMQIAAHYKLDNLIGIIDISRLEQTGETPYRKSFDDHGAHDLQKKIDAFGWNTIITDGHSLESMADAYHFAQTNHNKPTMILAVTTKGKGISFLAGKDNWHGKSLNKEQLAEALKELGEINKNIKGKILLPKNIEIKNIELKNIEIKKIKKPNTPPHPILHTKYPIPVTPTSTRKAFGQALANIGLNHPEVVSLDAGMSNSTYSQTFKEKYPDRFFEMFIAEQNMVGVASGLAKRGKIPFVSTFAAFFTRSFDQIRMASYAKANIKFVGSHAGVSMGEDGASQMGLEDIAMFRSVFDSVILYPSDAISTTKLVQALVDHQGLGYLRTTRQDTPILYDNEEPFYIGGSKVLRQSEHDQITLIGAGITLHECLKAYTQLHAANIQARVIDLYSIKPIDQETLLKASQETNAIFVVEDHYPQGGISEAVRSSLYDSRTPIYSLAVENMSRSGKSEDLLDYQKISARAIVEKVIKSQ